MNDLIAVKRLAEWQRMKALVLDSVSSPITRRVYGANISSFTIWLTRARDTRPTRARSA